jgi:probable HAF family extracellular repeat protein
VSAKVDVIVGRANSADCEEAARWSPAEGLVGLGDLPGGKCESIAFGVSADGGTIVGYASSEAGQEAFLWTRAAGMRSLRSVLLDAGVRDVEAGSCSSPTACPGTDA